MGKRTEQSPDRDRSRALLGRLGLLLAVIAGAYAAFTYISRRYFEPNLTIESVQAVEESVGIGEPVKFGFKVSNDRWGDGSAFAVLVIEGETEIEGPVTTVPARENADVMVEAVLKPGWRTGSLILYDAGRDNTLIETKSGLPVRVGSTDIVVTAVNYPATARRGETVTISIEVSNRTGAMDARLVPIVVVLTEKAEEVAETDGRAFLLPAGADTTVKLAMPTRKLEKNDYFLAVIMTDPATGKKIGQAKYRQPLRIR